MQTSFYCHETGVQLWRETATSWSVLGVKVLGSQFRMFIFKLFLLLFIGVLKKRFICRLLGKRHQ